MSKTWNKWAEEDIQLLKDNWTTPPDMVTLCDLLGRSMASIYHKANKLKLKCKLSNKWTDEEINILKEYWVPPINKDLLIEKLPNHTINSIYNKAKLLGLKNISSKEAIRAVYKVDEKIDKLFTEYEKHGDMSKACKTVHMERKSFKKLYNKDEKFRNRYLELKALKHPITENETKIPIEISRKYHKKYKNTLRGRLKGILDRSKRNCESSDLTFDFLEDLYDLQEGKCYYLGIPMEYDCENRYKYMISLDRKDSTKQYTKDNVVLCCWVVNKCKNDLSLDEFIELCNTITKRFAQ